MGNFMLGLKDGEQKKAHIKNNSKLQAVCYFKWQELSRKKDSTHLIIKNNSDHFRKDYKVFSCVLCVGWIAVIGLTT